MLKMLDSVGRGFPIGSILMWETSVSVTSTDWVGPMKVGARPDGLVSYLLDGQQRMSTLLGTLLLPEIPSTEGVKDIDWSVYFDLQEQEFMHAPRAGVLPHHFPIRQLLSTRGYLDACRAITKSVDSVTSDRLIAQADTLADRFRNYQIAVITIKSEDLDTAISVFARLNLTGRKMSPDQMVSALTYREGDFHLADALDRFLADDLAPLNFGGLSRTFILRTVLAAMGRDIYAKDWSDLMVKDEVRKRLPDAFGFAKTAILRALVFLKEQGATSDRMVPYGLQIVMLAEFFRRCSQPKDEQLELLRRWFWVTSLTGWFGGVNTAQARQALEEIRELADGSLTTFKVVDLDAPAQPFPDRFDARSARVRAFMLYLASLKPIALDDTGEILDVGRLLSERGPGALRKIATTLTDRALSSSPGNRMFAQHDQAGQAVTTLRGLDDETLRLVLPSHGFPEGAAESVQTGDRDTLIQQRIAHLVDQERNFMIERGVKPANEKTGPIIADTDMDEPEP